MLVDSLRCTDNVHLDETFFTVIDQNVFEMTEKNWQWL